MSTLAAGSARRMSRQSPTRTVSTSRAGIRVMSALMNHAESCVNGGDWFGFREFREYPKASKARDRRGARVRASGMRCGQVSDCRQENPNGDDERASEPDFQ